MSRFVLLVLTFITFVSADVLHLTEKEFSKYVDGSTNLLVEFYAPWCGHCKNLAPEYKIAGETFLPTDDVKIIAIDATEAPKLSQTYGIQGYPTLKWFPKGSTEPEEFNGGRTADAIIKWINEKIGTRRVLKTPPSAVTVLTSENFDDLVLGSKGALVEFYAPWCGHCKKLAPEYEQVAKVFAGDKEVLIAKVDATEEASLGNKYGIQGYPTIKFFPPGSSEPEDYEGDRQVEGFVNFINTKVGTQRKPDGSLLETAGRIDSFDSLIATATAMDQALVQALKDAATSVPEALQTAAKVYLTVADKIATQGVAYVSKELTRIGNILSGSNITPESKTNFQLKQNILKAFEKN